MVSPWIAIGLSGAAFLAAAKAHGRQVRIERELAGYWRVEFAGRNPPFVLDLWRRDRIVLWSLAAAVLVGLIAYVFASVEPHWKLPLTDSINRPYWWGYPFLGIFWPVTAGFFGAGLACLIRTLAAFRKGESQVREWVLQAFWGSIGWWALAKALAAASLLLAFHSGL